MSSPCLSHLNGPVLHILVVGFHHKKGCQVEFSYPPLLEGASNSECPDEWKNLPSLAMPDGVHNFDEDTVYFHLPSKQDPQRTVFGVSCCRQINSDTLLNKGADVTRSTVQKSVCVISSVPLYGLIQAKLSLITQAYFAGRDFSEVSLLKEAFRSLNASIGGEMLKGPQAFLGLSARDLVLHFKHKLLILFKLILLEKKMLFLKSPVHPLCGTILTLLSLFPGMMESGLYQSTYAAPVVSEPEDSIIDDEYVEVTLQDTEESDCPTNEDYSPDSEFKSQMDARTPEHRNKTDQDNRVKTLASQLSASLSFDKTPRSPARELNNRRSPSPRVRNRQPDPRTMDLENLIENEINERVDLTKSKLEFSQEDEDINGSRTSLNSKTSINSQGSSGQISSKITAFRGKMFGAFSYLTGKEASNGIVMDNSQGKLENGSTTSGENTAPSAEEKGAKVAANPTVVMNLTYQDCGLPLQIFTKGNVLHPYMSLPYLHILTDVRCFVVGASNYLFKQKKQLADAVIEIDEYSVDILDPDLRKLLYLTTEDLRFTEYLIQQVSAESDDDFLDGTVWEGGEEWLRAQFRYYLVCLLRTSLEESDRSVDGYNPSFVSAWKTTHNYQTWLKSPHDKLMDTTPGHPFQGQLSIADMRLRFSHAMQSSERSKKITQAVVSTGRSVAYTGKVVGGALTSAKSAVSSWFYSLSITNGQQINGQEMCEFYVPEYPGDTNQKGMDLK